MAPVVTIYENNADLVTPGYFFVSPYQQIQETPHIYDNNGVSLADLGAKAKDSN